jgi:hypothetical protein
MKTTSFERFEAFLFSRKFIFLVVIAGTVPMILHTHQLFYKVSPFDGNNYFKNAYALFYAISFDLTILVFTIHFIKRKPELYALFAFIINLLYYNPFGFIDDVYIIGFTKIFLSAILAFTGYSYAELFVEKMSEIKNVNKAVNTDEATEKPFICLECNKEFRTVKALNGHMGVHKTEKKPEPIFQN